MSSLSVFVKDQCVVIVVVLVNNVNSQDTEAKKMTNFLSIVVVVTYIIKLSLMTI